MKKRRMSQMTDEERQRLMSIAGRGGEQMAEQGAASMQKGLASIGTNAAKAMKQPDTSTVKTVEAPAEQMEELPEMKNPMDMQEPEASGLDDAFRQERRRRLRARLFTA